MPVDPVHDRFLGHPSGTNMQEPTVSERLA